MRTPLILITSAYLLCVIGLFAGCASNMPETYTCYDNGKAPFTSEHPTVPFVITNDWQANGVPVWFADGKPTLLTAHNPTNYFLEVHIRCYPRTNYGDIDAGHHTWNVCLPAKTDKARFVQFLNINVNKQVCAVERFYKSTTEKCVQDSE